MHIGQRGSEGDLTHKFRQMFIVRMHTTVETLEPLSIVRPWPVWKELGGVLVAAKSAQYPVRNVFGKKEMLLQSVRGVGGIAVLTEPGVEE